MSAYSEQLVYAPSEDQRVQAGVLIRPAGGAARPIGIVCIHGATGFFYLPLLVNLGRALAQQGYRFVSGNTRGHDVAAHDFLAVPTYGSIGITPRGWGRAERQDIVRAAHNSHAHARR